MASDLPRFTLRLSKEKLNKIKDIAKKEHRSTNEQINYILDKYVEDYEAKQKPTTTHPM